jgi:hypothetical protein
MTPQQLKALLPTSNPVDSSSNTTPNNTEKLYSLNDLANHFEIAEGAIRYYAKQNKLLPSKIIPAKFGFSNYYKLSDFRNYRPIKRTKRFKNIITDNGNYTHTVLQIANHYKLSRQEINHFIRLKKIKCVYKISSTRPVGSCAMLRHVKPEDFYFLKKEKLLPKKQFKGFTLFQRIKLLFGLDI